MTKRDDPSMSERRLLAIEKGLSDHTVILRELHKTSGDRGQKFILFTNSGAVLATLTFMGSNPDVRANPAVWHALTYFLLGVVLCGLLGIVDFYVTAYNLTRWVKDVDAFWLGNGDLETPGQSIQKTLRWSPWVTSGLGVVSFFFFCAGTCIGIRAVSHIELKPAIVSPALTSSTPSKTDTPQKQTTSTSSSASYEKK